MNHLWSEISIPHRTDGDDHQNDASGRRRVLSEYANCVELRLQPQDLHSGRSQEWLSTFNSHIRWSAICIRNYRKLIVIELKLLTVLKPNGVFIERCRAGASVSAGMYTDDRRLPVTVS